MINWQDESRAHTKAMIWYRSCSRYWKLENLKAVNHPDLLRLISKSRIMTKETSK